MNALLAATATREVQWNVPDGLVVFMYASMAAALAIFAYGIWRRARIWRLGRPYSVRGRPWLRTRRMLAGLAQVTVLRRVFPGVMHALLYYGFLVLFAATVMVFLYDDLGIDGVFEGDFYLWFESLTVDIFGILFLVGAGIGFYRRYVVRPAYLARNEPWDALLLGSLFAIALTGFGLEGIRIEATADPWASWSPGGNVVAHAVSPLSDGVLEDVFPWLWGLHVLMWHVLLAALPFTKALHWFTTPANLFFARPVAPRSVPTPTDFEAEEVRLGIKNASDMTWKQLFDLDSCTECGRCTSVCPAYASGSALDPKRVIIDLRDAIRARGLAAEPLAGDVVSYEALWACTTCRACEEACPVGIEHVPTILGLRQNLAMEQVRMPGGVSDLVANLEAREHPFRGATAGRTDWAEGLDVPALGSVAEAGGAEVVYWIGCAAAFDERAQKIARAVVRVLRHAGVRFAVVSSQERCNGDVARRTGNEFHYDLLARENVEMLNGAGVTTLLTHCPHCLEQLRYEYERFGGRYEVRHHSALVSALIEEGRVRLRPGERERVTYHDPCYLGRYNREFDAPRRVLDVLGVERVEMPRHGAESFCCGAGGGHAFFDETEGPDKVNQIRTREAAATGATTVVTGCPFCLTMLASGARAVGTPERTLRTMDFVELVAEALDE
ncbi:MAG: heterodisulfide reductase-related iron-sulfur binding cluster [Gaiella sp.]|nr:heterodisulfide reductase-related iron-sulfur binding cluster [Gaiella sp.]